eukprot:scaffold32232_cov55-Phaeocystis_antarctica.AAC.1
MPLPPRPLPLPPWLALLARFVAIGLRSLLDALRIFTGLAPTAAAEAPFRSFSVCLRSLSRREGEPAPRCETPKEPLLAAGLLEVAQMGTCLARAVRLKRRPHVSQGTRPCCTSASPPSPSSSTARASQLAWRLSEGGTSSRLRASSGTSARALWCADLPTPPPPSAASSSSSSSFSSSSHSPPGDERGSIMSSGATRPRDAAPARRAASGAVPSRSSVVCVAARSGLEPTWRLVARRGDSLVSTKPSTTAGAPASLARARARIAFACSCACSKAAAGCAWRRRQQRAWMAMRSGAKTRPQVGQLLDASAPSTRKTIGGGASARMEATESDFVIALSRLVRSSCSCVRSRSSMSAISTSTAACGSPPRAAAAGGEAILSAVSFASRHPHTAAAVVDQYRAQKLVNVM